MRFSEIFKQDKQPTPPPPPRPPSAPAREAAPQDADLLSGPPPTPARLEAAQETVAVFQQVIEAFEQNHPLPLTTLQRVTGALADAIARDVTGAFTEWTLAHNPDDPLARHACQTAILTAVITRQQRQTPGHLHELILAALLHDVGFLKVRDLISQPRRLSPQELAEAQRHQAYAEKYLSAAPQMPRLVLAVTAQCHERLDGTGYPAGLKNGEICEEARMVGVCCVFDALTHACPHRAARTPLEAFKLLTGELRKEFDPNGVKLLIEQVGLYPPGCLVELSTREQARVIIVNPRSPLRPVVEILKDPTGRPADEIRRLDLTKRPTLFITKVLGVTPSPEEAP